MLTKITDDLWVNFEEIQEINFNVTLNGEKYDALIIYKTTSLPNKTILSKEGDAEALKKVLERFIPQQRLPQSVHIPTVSIKTPFPHPDMVITTNCGGKECQNQE